MTTQITPTAITSIADGQALIVSSGRYQDSMPFSGIFEVFDLDLCVKRLEDGRIFATVNCAIEGDTSSDEDTTIDIELLTHYEGVIGSIDNVVKRIALI